MKRLAMSLVGAFFVFALCQAVSFAQTTGSIVGAVVDANGAVVPAATVVVKGTGGQEFTVVTNDSGIYRVPSVASGVYTVTTTAPNFKRSSIRQVSFHGIGGPPADDRNLSPILPVYSVTYLPGLYPSGAPPPVFGQGNRIWIGWCSSPRPER